jgi:hypothetical protein
MGEGETRYAAADDECVDHFRPLSPDGEGAPFIGDFFKRHIMEKRIVGVETQTTAFPLSMTGFSFTVYREPPEFGAPTREVFDEWLATPAMQETPQGNQRKGTV